MKIFRALLAGDPSDAQATRDVALNFSKLADIERQAGNYAAALEWASRQIPTFEALALSDPANVLLQGNVAAAYSVIGDLEIRLGRPSDARATFERMTALQERVTKTDPNHADFQYTLATAYGQMGDATSAIAATKGATPAAREDWRIARRWYERAHEMFAALDKRGTLTGSDAQSAGKDAGGGGALRRGARQAVGPSAGTTLASDRQPVRLKAAARASSARSWLPVTAAPSI